MGGETGVTVFCTTYNQGKYIAKTIESFLRQKTDFPVEIVIHDDASTDNTTEIILRYAKKYKNIIPVIEKENLYGRGLSYAKICSDKMHGKYIALCEGDDYWCDDRKLQKQYDAMERHSHCQLCVNKTRIVNAVSGKVTGHYPQFRQDTGEISPKKLLHQMGLYGTCYRYNSYFCRREAYLEYNNDYPVFRKVSDIGDGTMLLYFCQLNSVYYIDEVMSCYRQGVTDSWTTAIAKDRERRLRHFEKWKLCMNLYNEYTNRAYADECGLIKKYWEFNKLLYLGEYRRLLSKRYKEIFGARTLRFRCRVYLGILKQKISG